MSDNQWMTVLDDDLEVASDLISNAFNIVVRAEQAGRPPNDDELEQLIYTLAMGSSRLRKLPGGADAATRALARTSADLALCAPKVVLSTSTCPVCGDGMELELYPPTFLPSRRRPLGASYSCGHFISIPQGQR